MESALLKFNAMKTRELELIRDQTKLALSRVGLGQLDRVPLLESVLDDLRLRPEKEIGERALCLNAILAAAYGLPKELGLKWLSENGLLEYLTPDEKDFLEGRASDRQAYFQLEHEAIFGLCWMLGVAKEMPVTLPCPDTLVRLLPDLRRMEVTSKFMGKCKSKDTSIVVSMLDQLVCLHWLLRQAQIEGSSVRTPIPEYAVIERRKALQWALGVEDWDSVSLDT